MESFGMIVDPIISTKDPLTTAIDSSANSVLETNKPNDVKSVPDTLPERIQAIAVNQLQSMAATHAQSR